MLLQLLIQWQLDLVLFLFVLISATAALRHYVQRSYGVALPSRQLAIALGVILLGTGLSAKFLGDYEERRIEDTLKGYVKTYADELDRLGLATITAQTPPDDPVYLRMIERQKAWLAANPAVADIYTFGPGNRRFVRLLVDSETDYDYDGDYRDPRERRTPIGETYPTDRYIQRAFDGELTFDPYFNDDAWGVWISAFAPVRDAGGDVAAVVGVDFPATTWVTGMLGSRFAALMGGAVVFLVISAAAITVGSVQARLESEATMRARDAFLANVSHEIRTPMTGALGVTELLLDTRLSAEQRHHVEMIRDSGRTLLGIINDILDYSKLRGGHIQLQPEPVDLTETVRAVLDLERPAAERKGLYLDLQIPDRVPVHLLADRLRLRQVLTNLIGNAVKFTPRGGVTVTLHCQLSPPEPAAPEGTAHLRIEVTDTGIGISDDAASRLFTPFEQGDPATTRQFGGTGLGLALTRDLVMRMDGSLSFRSKPGEGTTFFTELHLPVCGAPVRRLEVALTQATPRCEVLVVEDGELNRTILKSMLEKDGHGVDVACDGAQAVERCANKAYDLVFMDQQMPIMDGIAATRAIRSREGTQQHLPIVALTASAMPSDRARCLAAGMDDFLSKPFTREQLRAILAGWARRPGSRATFPMTNAPPIDA